ncbi:hypothetical protein LTS10_003683 [Elasticomyces elasticus]|nr:hypothetical protein LTS10_003683 [Elasticomyces elasticus]
MPETSAGARFFGTPELLESILLQLADTPKGWTELLLSQRVCQTFKATIGSSPSLQEILHFRVSAETLDDNASNRYNKHVLMKVFQPTCQVDNGGGIVRIIIDDWDYDVHIISLHPTMWNSNGNVSKGVFAKQLPGPDVDDVLPMKLASWRRMVLKSTEARVKIICSHKAPHDCLLGFYSDRRYYNYRKSPFCDLKDAKGSKTHFVELPGGIEDGETVEGLLRRLWPGRWL